MTTETRVGFMCMTDFDDELENAAGGNKVYPSLEDLKRNCTCWDTCGVVEVTVTRGKVVVPQNLFPDTPTRPVTLVRDGAFNWLSKLTRRERMGPIFDNVKLPPPGRPFTTEEAKAMLDLGKPRDCEED